MPFFGNGDILSFEEYDSLLKGGIDDLDGIMIGR
jgi:hypothetical protein